MARQQREDALAAPRRVVALGLWGISLVVLVVSGSVGTEAPDLQDRSTAAVAGVLGVVSVLVGVRERAARRALGIAFVTLVGATVVGTFVPGFHFLWPAGSPQLLALLVVFSVVGLGLLSPSLRGSQPEYVQRGSSEHGPAPEGVDAGRGMSPEARTLLWLVTGLVFSAVGYNLGGLGGRPVLGCVLAMVLCVAVWAAVTVRRHRRG